MAKTMCRLLGQKLRRIREARGFVLKDVEQISGISATHISEIERARTAPTVQLLDRLAQALQVSTACLLELPPLDSPHIHSSGHRRILESPDGLASLERLSEIWSFSALELHRIHLKAEGILSGEVPPTEDLIIVINGEIQAWVDGDGRQLTTGMGLHACTRDRIILSNKSGGTVELLWATRSVYCY